jgi:heme oxygenase
MDPPPPPPSYQGRLTERINRATKSVHEVSGKSINWKLSLILTSRSCYAEAISLFWIVYQEIEALYEKHQMDHPALRKLQPVAPIFQRASKFRDDILFMMPTPAEAEELMNRRGRVADPPGAGGEATGGKDIGSGNRSSRATTMLYTPPELQAYVDRLHRVADSNPIQLIAYMYAMYGAITGGGVAIQKMVQRTFGLPRPSKVGVQIFELDLDGTPFQSGKEAWTEFKRILDEDIQLNESDIQLILAEAPQVFIGNNALVGTVQDTRAFRMAARGACNLVGTGLAVMGAVAAVAAGVHYYLNNIRQVGDVSSEL